MAENLHVGICSQLLQAINVQWMCVFLTVKDALKTKYLPLREAKTSGL